MADWKDVIKTVAPTIGAALGGPMGGVATKFLADQLLGKPDAGTDDVVNKVNNLSHDELLKLKQIDNDFSAKMNALDVDVFRLETQGVANARELFKVDTGPQIILSAAILIGYFVILILFLTCGNLLPKMNDWTQSMLSTIIGVLTAGVPQILGFWFGSSLGSKEKTRIMGNTINQNS